MASASDQTVIFSTSDEASIALLRRLRAGATVPFVHHVDVCSAAPEDLVAGLTPAPGTDVAEDGYHSIWLFYCPKKFKNTQGKASGHRQRAIAGGDTCWHSECSPRPVKNLEGATFCNLSFGRKEQGSSRSFNRLGWCMTEFDDKINGGGDHVLCKVHRSSSSLAKGKLKPTTTQRSSGSSKSKKRKAMGDHPLAPPSKISVCASVDQVQPPLLSGYQMTECSDYVPVDYESLFLGEEEPLQHNTVFPTVDEQLQQNAIFPATEEQQLQQNAMFPVEEQQFEDNTLFTMDEFFNGAGLPNIEFTMDEQSGGTGYGDYGACLPDSVFNMDSLPTMDDLFSGSTGCCDTPKAMAPPDAVFFEGLAF